MKRVTFAEAEFDRNSLRRGCHPSPKGQASKSQPVTLNMLRWISGYRPASAAMDGLVLVITNADDAGTETYSVRYILSSFDEQVAPVD